MGLLSTVFSSAGASAVEGLVGVVDKFVQTPDEKATLEILKARMLLEPSLAQIELNKIEASHRSIFVAGWRPFIGWVCGFSLAWHFIGYDMLLWVQASLFPQAAPAPVLGGTEQLISVVFSLLGLGAFRTLEKINGKAK